MMVEEKGENQLHILCCQSKTALVTLEKQRYRLTALAWVALSGTLLLAGPKVVQVVLSPWVEPPIATDSKNCVEEKGASRSARGEGGGRKQPHCHP